MWWVDRWRQSDAFARMTAEEQGLFRNLCDEVFLRDDGVIPDNPRILAKASGDHEAWARSGSNVLKSMKRVAGGWTNETALKVKEESEKRARKQRDYRNGAGNDSGNGDGNGSDNEARPQEQDQDKGKKPVQGPTDAEVAAHEAAKAKCRSALAEASKATGLPGADLLSLPEVRPPHGSPITNFESIPCISKGTRLLEATAGKLLGIVASRRGDALSASRRKTRKGGGSWDRADQEQADTDARAADWIDAQRLMPIHYRSEIEAVVENAPTDIQGTVCMLLIARNPHLRPSIPKTPPDHGNPTEPQRPELTLTVCQEPDVGSGSDGGEAVRARVQGAVTDSPQAKQGAAA